MAIAQATLPHLQAFLAVARLKSFSAAARELGVTRSAISQSVKHLEDALGVTLLVRTTRSVAVTEAGERLAAGAAPALRQVATAMEEASAQPGEIAGRVRLTVPRAALPYVIEPVLPELLRRHPRVEVEVSIEDRLVDIVAEGFDAGVRLSEALDRDMVQVRLTDAFRFVVVASPAYLAEHGTPERPADLLDHQCITFRSPTTRALYAWELERGRKAYRVPVRGNFVCSDSALAATLAERGAGLAYAFEPHLRSAIRKGRLVVVLERYAPTVPGFFLYYPSVAGRSAALRAFIDTAKDLGRRTLK